MEILVFLLNPPSGDNLPKSMNFIISGGVN